MLIKEQHEFGIAVVKPDGLKKGVLSQLYSEIERNGLKITFQKKVKLQKEDIFQNFITDFDLDVYADYLSSDCLIVLLVSGDSAAYTLRQIKLSLRKGYGFSSEDMMNLIHTVDHGNEYFYQFRLFFPELCPTKYSGYADMNYTCDIQNDEEILEKLLFIERETNLSWLGYIVKSNFKSKAIGQFYQMTQYSTLGIILGLKHKFFLNNNPINLIGYLPPALIELPNLPSIILENTKEFIKWITDFGGTVVLDYLPLHQYTLDLLLMLKDQGLRGVVIYDPRRTLHETIQLEDLIECETKMFFSGGTGGILDAAQLSIGKRDFSKLMNGLVS